MKRTSLLALATLLLAALARLDAAEDKPARAFLTAASSSEAALTREQRIRWWREARFGMFIYWGLYSIPAGVWKDKTNAAGYSEWIMFGEKIPAKEYERLAGRFNPVKFDAKAWTAIAKKAGMKYMILTTKHHDGFSMFKSRLTSYNIVDATPFKRDVTRELADACHDAGLRFGSYYSIDRDWYRPQGPGNDYKQNNVWDYPDSKRQDFDRYFATFALPQVEELLTNYRPDLLWFDEIDMKSDAQVEELYQTIRKLRPACIVNSRIKTCNFPAQIPPPHCDYITSGDNEILDKAPGFEWENPGSMNTSYGYNQNDHNWVDAKEIVFRLVDIVSKGGNYLLNVGPTSEGLIPQPSIDRLMEVGAWLETNGEAIYGISPWKIFHDGPPSEREGAEDKKESTGSPVDIRFTAKGDSIYALCLAWPDKEVLVRALGKKGVPGRTIAVVRMLGATDEVKWRHTDDGFRFRFRMPNRAATPSFIGSISSGNEMSKYPLDGIVCGAILLTGLAQVARAQYSGTVAGGYPCTTKYP
jgi:alpha-L-fucosidase